MFFHLKKFSFIARIERTETKKIIAVVRSFRPAADNVRTRPHVPLMRLQVPHGGTSISGSERWPMLIAGIPAQDALDMFLMARTFPADVTKLLYGLGGTPPAVLAIVTPAL
jgi:hypothetical protein